MPQEAYALLTASLTRDILNKHPMNGDDGGCHSWLQAPRANASCEGTNFSGASLHAADLRGISLRNADLRGASLCYASLEGADTEGAQLDGAVGPFGMEQSDTDDELL